MGIKIITSLPVGEYYNIVNEANATGNFWEMIWANATIGQIGSIYWAFEAGRFCQTFGLLMMGMLISRGNYFRKDVSFWIKVLLIGIVSSYLFFIIKGAMTDSLKTIFSMWFNLAFTSVLISTFVILYHNESFSKMCSGLRAYGKMSLTNYISQSLIGSIIFFPYAFGLAPYLGVAVSLFIGVVVMLLQIKASQIWLKSYKQGPLENIWKQLTWINKKQSSVAVAG